MVSDRDWRLLNSSDAITSTEERKEVSDRANLLVR